MSKDVGDRVKVKSSGKILVIKDINYWFDEPYLLSDGLRYDLNDFSMYDHGNRSQTEIDDLNSVRNRKAMFYLMEF